MLHAFVCSFFGLGFGLPTGYFLHVLPYLWCHNHKISDHDQRISGRDKKKKKKDAMIKK
jgi:hypothetical protein